MSSATLDASRPNAARRRLRALGTYVHVAVDRAEALGPATAVVSRVLEDVDRTCSRFRDDSDLSRANASPGRWVDVDPLLVEAVSVAVDAAAATDGLVDPLLGRSMMLLGYDRTFSAVERCAEPAPSTAPGLPAPRPGAWRAIGLDRGGRVRVPAGTALDLGATGKAFAADLAATAAAARAGAGVLVSVGGDLRIAEPRPDGPAPALGGWPVRVSERPDDPDGPVVLLGSGGLATSSTVVRRWLRGGVERHHLLDPRTGLPVPTAAPGAVRTATATGPTATAANAAATCAVVLGADADAWLTARGVCARLVGGDGAVRGTGDWPGAATRTGPHPTDAPGRTA